MRNVLYARFLLIKRYMPKMIFWMIMPLMAAIVITLLVNRTSDDFKVPAALVIHEESAETEMMIEGFKDSRFIDVQVFSGIRQQDALRKLEQYQFDSVFIFTEGFSEKLKNGQRRNLLESYYTDRSLYYEPSKELIASLVQEQIGVHTTVDNILKLEEDLNGGMTLASEKIVDERKRIETETNLGEQIFYFLGEHTQDKDERILNPWTVWAYFTFAVTIFIFDFVTRETMSTASSRFYYMKYSFTYFMIVSFTALTGMMLFFDMITYVIINNFLQADTSLLSLLLFRLAVNGIAFFLAYLMKSEMKLYQTAIGLTVILLALDLVIIFTGLDIITMLHPVVNFTEDRHNILWIVILLIITFIWIRRDKLA